MICIGFAEVNIETLGHHHPALRGTMMERQLDLASLINRNVAF